MPGLEELMAPYQAGDMRRNMPPPPRPTGVLESLMGAIVPRRDENGMPQAPGAGEILMSALMAMPGMGRPTATMPKGPMFRANNYAEPGVAANAIPAHEMSRLQRQLGDILPITPANEAQAQALRAQIRKLDEMHDAAFWGRAPASKPNPLTTDLDQLYGAGSPRDRARQLGIRVVDPNAQ